MTLEPEPEDDEDMLLSSVTVPRMSSMGRVMSCSTSSGEEDG